MAEPAEPLDDVDHPAVAKVGHVFLEGKAEHQHAAGAIAEPLVKAVGDPGAHAVVDFAPGKDHPRFVAEFAGAVGEIIGIDPDAVAADEAGLERQEVPLGAGGLQHVPGTEAELGEDLRDLVDEGDVDVALGVLDHLGRLRRLDRCSAEDPPAVHRAIQVGKERAGLRILARDDLDDAIDGMLAVARIDPLRAVAEAEMRCRA